MPVVYRSGGSRPSGGWESVERGWQSYQLIVFPFFLAVLLGGIAWFWYNARRVDRELNRPITAEASREFLGPIPLYPNAQLSEEETKKMRKKNEVLAHMPGVSVFYGGEVAYTSTDRPEVIAAWYDAEMSRIGWTREKSALSHQDTDTSPDYRIRYYGHGNESVLISAGVKEEGPTSLTIERIRR